MASHARLLVMVMPWAPMLVCERRLKALLRSTCFSLLVDHTPAAARPIGGGIAALGHPDGLAL